MTLPDIPPAIAMEGITKCFPGICANDNITLRVEKGTIHALLGENGAGKSTLMSILFGLIQPDSGTVHIHGKPVRIDNPAAASTMGIAMVHQHFKLVDTFTVTENIILGQEPTKGAWLDRRAARARIVALSDRYGLQVDPDATIDTISVGMQQRVEILKMLYRNADIMIFDEPTAVLTPQETEDLLGIMGTLVQEGKTLVLITHKLKEILAVAHHCTVLRRGKLVGTVAVADTTEKALAEMMVGRAVNFRVDKQPARPGKPLLRLDRVKVRNSKGLLGVDGLSLTVHAGEILGICGIDGNGQTELVQAIAGLLPVESGEIFLKEQPVKHVPVKTRAQMGLGHIPEDRHKHGLILDFSLQENAIIHVYDQPPFSRLGVLNADAAKDYATRLYQAFDVRAAHGVDTPVRAMSGGNQQKVILAREIDPSPDVLLVAQPTRGLDVGAIEYIHQRLVAERDKGKGILLVSLEMDELLAVTDRIVVIHQGRVMGEVASEQASTRQLGLMMAGHAALDEQP